MVSASDSNTRTLLANVLAALLSSSAADASPLSNLSAMEKEVVAQLADKARVNLSRGLDRKSISKLLEAGNDALIGLTVGDIKRADSTAKLGSLGLLSPQNYQVKITDVAKQSATTIGLSVNQIKDAVSKPDAYQHLSPPADFGMGELISIFVKIMNKSSATGIADADWLIAICRREGNAVHVYDVLRTFGDELEMHGLSTPLDLLKSFANRFGFPVKVAGTDIGKFCTYKLVDGDNLKVDIPNGAPDQFDVQFFARLNENPKRIEVALAFAVDKQEYKNSLRAHSIT